MKKGKFLLKCDYMSCIRLLGLVLVFVPSFLGICIQYAFSFSAIAPKPCLNFEHYLESLNGWKKTFFSFVICICVFTIYLDYVGSCVAHRLYLIVCFPSFRSTQFARVFFLYSFFLFAALFRATTIHTHTEAQVIIT